MRKWQWWMLFPWLYEWKQEPWFHPIDGSYIGTAHWKERKRK